MASLKIEITNSFTQVLPIHNNTTQHNITLLPFRENTFAID